MLRQTAYIFPRWYAAEVLWQTAHFTSWLQTPGCWWPLDLYWNWTRLEEAFGGRHTIIARDRSQRLRRSKKTALQIGDVVLLKTALQIRTKKKLRCNAHKKNCAANWRRGFAKNCKAPDPGYRGSKKLVNKINKEQTAMQRPGRNPLHRTVWHSLCSNILPLRTFTGHHAATVFAGSENALAASVPICWNNAFVVKSNSKIDAVKNVLQFGRCNTLASLQGFVLSFRPGLHVCFHLKGFFNNYFVQIHVYIFLYAALSTCIYICFSFFDGWD